MKKFGKKVLLVGIILGGFLFMGCDVKNKITSLPSSAVNSGDVIEISGKCAYNSSPLSDSSDTNTAPVSEVYLEESKGISDVIVATTDTSNDTEYNIKYTVSEPPGTEITSTVTCKKDIYGEASSLYGKVQVKVNILGGKIQLESIPASVVVGASVPLKASLASAATAPLNISFAAVAAAKGSAAMAKTNCTIPVGGTSCSTSMTATSAGNFSLSAAVINYAPASAKLTVLPVPPTSITISPTTATLARGGSTSFTAVLSGANSKTSSQNLTLTDAKSPGDGISITPSSCNLTYKAPSCAFTVKTASKTPAAIYSLKVGYNNIVPNAVNIPLEVLASKSLTPESVANSTTMTFVNGTTAQKVTSITTNNSNVNVAVNGNFCSGQTIAANGSCNFVLSATSLPTPTNVKVTLNYSNGSSDQFDVVASSSANANFSLNDARYLLVRYLWVDGDFDTASGFQSLTPTKNGFPVFTAPIASSACVGYPCSASSSDYTLQKVAYNSQTLISFAGDNTSGGEEDALVDLWLLPTGTTSFNFALWGYWYLNLGVPSTVTVGFETYANGTTFTLGNNKNFIASSSALTSSSAITDVTWAGDAHSAQLMSNNGLVCNYASSITTGRANNGACSFVGK